MEDSILNSIKKMLGFTEDYTAYDQDLIININMVLNILTQIGVGPKGGYEIEDASNTWDEFIGDNIKLNMVKSYVYLKVKRVFDPGTSGSLNDAIDNQIKELESRISYEVDPGDSKEETS